MSEEEIKELEKALMGLPKIKSDVPISVMDGINFNEFMEQVEMFKKVPSYDDLLRANNKLKKQLDLYKSVIDEINKQIKYYTETTFSEYSDASLIVDLKIILSKANIKEGE